MATVHELLRVGKGQYFGKHRGIRYRLIRNERSALWHVELDGMMLLDIYMTKQQAKDGALSTIERMLR